MDNLNIIGLDSDKMTNLANKLNTLLAHYETFYQNLRGFHWNIRGEKFFELHLKFEELYSNIQVKIDEIAERVLTIGHTPLHTFSDYLKASTIKEARDVSDGKQCIAQILESFRSIISLQREILDLSADAGDEGTNSLVSDYIREQEKLVWMYNAYMGRL